MASLMKAIKCLTNSDVLPKPGGIIQHDFRRNKSNTSRNKLKVVQWNIERGYQLEGIINELKSLDADIIGLQEIDIHCERSGYKDVGREIASSLEMNYVFVCEFVEFHSKLRSNRDQGGGVHGNAILSKFDFLSCESIRHSHHPIDWEAGDHSKAKSEPRKGERLILGAIIDVAPTPIVVYSCHLEVFCGISHRLYQFSDVLRDSLSKIEKGYDRQLVLGDMNTVGDGITRLLPNFCTDHLRFRTLGIREATFWKENLFNVTSSTEEYLEADAEGFLINRRLRLWGLDAKYCRDLINPGFHDCFDTEKDFTLSQPKHWNLVKGKLDWLLAMNLKVSEKSMGNHNYSLSDHKWLMVAVDI